MMLTIDVILPPYLYRALSSDWSADLDIIYLMENENESVSFLDSFVWSVVDIYKGHAGNMRMANWYVNIGTRFIKSRCDMRSERYTCYSIQLSHYRLAAQHTMSYLCNEKCRNCFIPKCLESIFYKTP